MSGLQNFTPSQHQVSLNGPRTVPELHPFQPARLRWSQWAPLPARHVSAPPLCISLAGSHAQISASSSSLPSVTYTVSPEPKTSIGVIAGGKSSIHHPFPTTSAKALGACHVFSRYYRWCHRSVHRRIRIFLLLQTEGSQNP